MAWLLGCVVGLVRAPNSVYRSSCATNDDDFDSPGGTQWVREGATAIRQGLVV